MQPKQNMPMSRKDDNILDNFGPYKDEKSIPEMQDIEKDHRDLVDKNFDNRNYAKYCLSGYTL